MYFQQGKEEGDKTRGRGQKKPSWLALCGSLPDWKGQQAGPRQGGWGMASLAPKIAPSSKS